MFFSVTSPTRIVLSQAMYCATVGSGTKEEETSLHDQFPWIEDYSDGSISHMIRPLDFYDLEVIPFAWRHGNETGFLDVAVCVDGELLRYFEAPELPQRRWYRRSREACCTYYEAKSAGSTYSAWLQDLFATLRQIKDPASVHIVFRFGVRIETDQREAYIVTARTPEHAHMPWEKWQADRHTMYDKPPRARFLFTTA